MQFSSSVGKLVRTTSWNDFTVIGAKQSLADIRIPLFCVLVSVDPFWLLADVLNSFSLRLCLWRGTDFHFLTLIWSLVSLLFSCCELLWRTLILWKGIETSVTVRISRQSLPTLDYYFEDAHSRLSVKKYQNKLPWFWKAYFRVPLSIICHIP